MPCPHCGAENPPGTTTCQSCGGMLARAGDPNEPYLLWEAEDGTPQSIYPANGITIGRATGNELVIPDSAMSRQHARIEPSPRGLVVIDLGSLNGVLVNDQRIDESHVLRDGDVVTVGRTRFTVRLPQPEEPPEEPPLEERTLRFDSPPELSLGAEPISDEPASQEFTIVAAGPAPVVSTDALPAAAPPQPVGFLIADDIRTPIYATLTVGRSEGNDIRIETDRLVSRNHARLDTQDDAVWLTDLGSANGTFVNGAQVAQPTELADGDEIRFGATAYRFAAVAKPRPAVDETPADEAETIHDLSAVGSAQDVSEESAATLMMEEDVQSETLRGSEADLYIREAEVAEFQALRSGTTEPVPVADVAGDEYRLIVNFGPDAGRQYPLDNDVTVIGRVSADADYDVRLNDRAVSRPHAKIVRERGAFILHDLDSANGTILNYTQEVTTPQRLADGDIIKLGRSTLVFRVPAALRPPEQEQVLDPRVGRIITLFSLKGGMGTTTLAVNLAVLLRQLTNQSVLLVDLSIERGAVSVHLNLSPRLSLADLPPDPAALDLDLLHSLIVSHESGIDVLPAPPSPQAAELVAPAAVSAVWPLLRSRYKWVVVDTSATFSELNLGVFDQSDLLLLVSAPDVVSLKIMQSMLDTFAALQTPAETRVLVINQTYPRAHIQTDDLEAALGERIGLTVPYAGDTVLESIDRGVPMAVAYRDHSVIQALESFVARVAKVKVEAESQPRRGGLGRWVQGVISSIRR